jgi:hypothetical protein
VVIGPERRNESGNLLWGKITHASGELYIWDGLSPDQQYVVLWHEMLHGIESQHDLDLGEGPLDTLAYGIVSLLEHNDLLPTPEVPEWPELRVVDRGGA